MSPGGFFGPGVYFADTKKANSYSPDRGNPEALRMMLRCRVLLGKTMVYKSGHSDRDLKRAPPGYNSVKGCLRISEEFVVYSKDQIYISEIVFYRMKDTPLELAPFAVAPRPSQPDANGKVTAHITQALDTYISTLRQVAKTLHMATQFETLFQHLLLAKISAEKFVEESDAMLCRTSPPGTCEMIKRELAISILPTLPPHVIGTSAGTASIFPDLPRVPPSPALPNTPANAISRSVGFHLPTPTLWQPQSGPALVSSPSYSPFTTFPPTWKPGGNLLSDKGNEDEEDEDEEDEDEEEHEEEDEEEVETEEEKKEEKEEEKEDEEDEEEDEEEVETEEEKEDEEEDEEKRGDSVMEEGKKVKRVRFADE